MGTKNYKKHLDTVSYNDSFNNGIFLPDDVANILPNYAYWNKELEAMWIQNAEEEDLFKRYTTAFIVTIKTNEEGLFINGNLAVEWSNHHMVQDNAIVYQSHGASIALLESIIGCGFNDGNYNSMIQFDFTDDIKEFVKKKHTVFIESRICNYSYWEKEEICVVVSEKTNLPKFRGKIMANEKGLHLDGNLLYNWDEYLPLIRSEKDNNERMMLFKKTELANWGSSHYGFCPKKSLLSIDDICVIDVEETIIIGQLSKTKFHYDSICEKKDFPVLKKQYNSLCKKNNSIFSPSVIIDCPVSSTKTSKFEFDFKWPINTGFVLLDFLDCHYQHEDEKLVKEPIMRFVKSSFTLILDKQIYHQLKLARTKGTNNIDCYVYYVSKSIIYQMSFAKRIDIQIEGVDYNFSVQANELIDVARIFKEELYDSPNHEQDYYKAIYLFEKKDYLDANKHILVALENKPNDAQYKELSENIRSKLVDIEAEDFYKSQTLYDEKKYGDSIKLLESIYVVEKEEEISLLRKKIVDGWAIDLINQGDENVAKNNMLFAVNYYKQALKLHPDDDELKVKLQTVENALSNKAKYWGKLTLIIIVPLLLLVVGIVKYNEYREEESYQTYTVEPASQENVDRSNEYSPYTEREEAENRLYGIMHNQHLRKEYFTLYALYTDYVFGDKDFSLIARNVCTPKLLQKLKDAYEYDCEDGECYATWLFKTNNQDGLSDVCEVKNISLEDDNWYKIEYVDMGNEGTTFVRLEIDNNWNVKMDELRLDTSYND